MTFDEIRTKLGGLEGKTYWRSLEELAGTPEFNEFLHREFPAHASEFTDPKGRRTFLKLMGASLALAGVSACTRQPDEKILPYVRQPEEIVPGRPLFYATSMPQGGVAMPLLAENHMGRPTKMEGNPEHPAGLGGTDNFGQASVLGLYDPDRSKSVMYRGAIKTYADFSTSLQNLAHAQKAIKGATLRFLTEPISSPSLLDQIEQIQTDFPDAKWHQWDAVYGVVQGGVAAETADATTSPRPTSSCRSTATSSASARRWSAVHEGLCVAPQDRDAAGRSQSSVRRRASADADGREGGTSAAAQGARHSRVRAGVLAAAVGAGSARATLGVG